MRLKYRNKALKQMPIILFFFSLISSAQVFSVFSMNDELQETYQKLLKIIAVDAHPTQNPLSLNINPHITNNQGETLLHLAAKRDHQKMLSVLLNYKVNLNAQDEDGNTPLHIALQFSNSKIANQILSLDPRSLYIRNKLGQTPFESIYVFKDCSESEPIFKIFDTKYTLFDLSFNKNFVPLLFQEYLKYSGAHALHIAAQCGDQEAVKSFLSKKVNVNVRQKIENLTPLHCAARQGHIKVVQILLEAKADINAKSSYQETPLFAAVVSQNEELVKILLAAGAKTDIPCSRLKKKMGTVYPIHAAFLYGNLKIIKMLLEAHANPNVLTKDEPEGLNMSRSSVLHLALQSRLGMAIEWILNANADVSIQDGNGNNVLHLIFAHVANAAKKKLEADDQEEEDYKVLARKLSVLEPIIEEMSAIKEMIESIILAVNESQEMRQFIYTLSIQDNNKNNPLHLETKPEKQEDLSELKTNPEEEKEDLSQNKLFYELLEKMIPMLELIVMEIKMLRLILERSADSSTQSNQLRSALCAKNKEGKKPLGILLEALLGEKSVSVPMEIAFLFK